MPTENARSARPPPAPARWIAHLDMDAFYASVELLRRPELRGQAVVVGGRRAVAFAPEAGQSWPRLRDYTGRGVVTTATYEARASGVHSGMGLMKAAALAPNALLLPADFDEYRRLSRAFKAAVAELAPAIEDRGIDEIYIDLSGLTPADKVVGHDPLGGLKALAQDIKNNVRERTGLSCSIGIAPNKLLAKICSDLDKPDGLTLLRPDEVETRIWPLPVRRLQGVGPKAGQRLDALGIQTIGDLARSDAGELSRQFGTAHAAWLIQSARGHDERPLVLHSEPVSVSRETTFERDLHPTADRAELTAALLRLCTQVAADLSRKGYTGRTIGIKLRFENFRTVTRDVTLPAPTDDAAALLAAARTCLRRVDLHQRLRLLGVRAGNLQARGQATERATAAPNKVRGEPTRCRQALSPNPESTLPLFDDTPPS